MKRIYLAGPIGGLLYNDANNWRDRLTNIFIAHDVECLSPMRDSSFLKGENPIVTDREYHDTPMSRDKGIMMRDYNDCVTSDLIFCNFLNATKISGGTFMELAWAYMRHIPVVCVIEETNNPNDHPMSRAAMDFRTSDLIDGVDIALSVLNRRGFR